MTPRRWARVALVAGLGLPALDAPPAEGQGVRGSLQTTARYLELRPIRQDTVSFDRVTERPDGVLEFGGFPVSCAGTGPCVFYRPAEVESAVAVTQDLSLTAWGLGTPGLSASTLLRGRADLGGDLTLPQSDDRFDAVVAYLEYDRASYRLRLGRQRELSGLGSTGYDGLAVLWEPLPWLRVEALGGRSLARGLSEPRREAFRGIEELAFLPDAEAVLLGGEVAVQPRIGTAVALRYQWEAWGASRDDLLSERASLTARTTALRSLVLSGSADYDFAFGEVGRANLSAGLPLLDRAVMLEGTARRYRPYFELWTIWGFFSPVAYHEGELRASWVASPGLMLWGSGAYRAYEEANAPVVFGKLEDTGWRAGAGAQWRPSDALSLEGSIHQEGPVGAFLTSADVRLGWRPAERWGASLHGAAFQQFEEFRVGEERVVGGGLSADAGLLPGTRLSGGVEVYRQAVENRPGMVDWNQTRGWMMLRVDFGRDPGLAGSRVP